MTRFLAATAFMLLAFTEASAGEAGKTTLYKDPECGCCGGYADHLRANGFDIEIVPTADLSEVKRRYGVPEALESCHTMLIDGYVVEGHVPLASLRRLIAEKPAVMGISLPGMPLGSPGMSGEKAEPFTVYEFGVGTPRVFDVE